MLYFPQISVTGRRRDQGQSTNRPLVSKQSLGQNMGGEVKEEEEVGRDEGRNSEDGLIYSEEVAGGDNSTAYRAASPKTAKLTARGNS